MCICVDVSPLAAAYYRMGSTTMTNDVRLYMNPEYRSVSVGEISNVTAGEDGTVLLRAEVAEYLLSTMPQVFSRTPYAKRQSKSTPNTTTED